MAYGKMAYVYDELMADMPYDQWVLWIEQHVPDQSATIVDLGCGTGAVSIPLSEKGYRVIGIDLSDNMLAVAASKAERTAIQWLEQDMVEWQVDEPVDAVVCICDGFNYLLEEQELERAIATTARQLKSGGVLLFDLLTERQMKAYAENQPFQYDEADLAYIWTSDWDDEDKIIHHALTFFVQAEDGRFDRFVEEHYERAYATNDVVRLLEKYGFIDIQLSSDFGRGSVNSDCDRLFVSARLR